MTSTLSHLKHNLIITIMTIITLAFVGCGQEIPTTGDEGETANTANNNGGSSDDNNDNNSSSGANKDENVNDDDDEDDKDEDGFSLGDFACHDVENLESNALELPYTGSAENVDDELPSHAVAFNRTYYFLYDNSDGNNKQLWRLIDEDTDVEVFSTPDTAGVGNNFEILSEADAGAEEAIRTLLVFNEELYFVATDDNFGKQLWKTDGSAFTRITGGGGSGIKTNDSAPANLQVLAGYLYFSAEHTNGNRVLWKTDGTIDGESTLGDTTVDSAPFSLNALNDKLYFFANSATAGDELHRLDPATLIVSVVKDIRSGNANAISRSNFAYAMTVIDDKLYFGANDGTRALIYESDGTEAGTIPVEADTRLDYTTDPATSSNYLQEGFDQDVPFTKGVVRTSSSLLYNNDDGNLAMYTPAAATENIFDSTISPADVVNGGTFFISKNDDDELLIGIPGGNSVELEIEYEDDEEEPASFAMTMTNITVTDTKHIMVSGSLIQDFDASQEAEGHEDTVDRYILSISCR